MAEPVNDVLKALDARDQLAAHKRILTKEIGGRDRRLAQGIKAIVHRSKKSEDELPLAGESESKSPEFLQLINDPLRGL